MTQRRRSSRAGRDHGGITLLQPAPGAEGAPDPEPRRRPTDALVRAAGLLPLRLFVGITYLYAGVDKLANAHFLTSGDVYSVAGQMAGYARTSPLASLIQAALPAAVPIGLLIALAELAVGLGLLTGLAFRLAAAAGAGLSVLFWLTASWSSTPYFFSPDLPYAFAFLTLALVGDGGIFTLSQRGRCGGPVGDSGAARIGRRSVLQVGILAVITFVAAGAAASLRLLGYGERPAGGTGAAAPTPPSATPSPVATASAEPVASAVATASVAPSVSAAPAASATASASAAPSASAADSGPVIGSLADFASGNSAPFTVPNQVPFAMGPGGPGIMVKLADGRVTAFSAVCTHGHCTVGFDQANMVIACPCHLATYDPAKSAAVLSGPAPLPLPEIPVAVDAGGQIHVTAQG